MPNGYDSLSCVVNTAKKIATQIDGSAYYHDATAQKHDATAHARKRDAMILHNVRKTDFAVYVKSGNVVRMAAIVRKDNGAIRYRLVTDNGLSPVHVVVGYTKRLPEKIMRQIVDAHASDNVYMRQVNDVLGTIEYHARRDTRSSGPHDRRPQKPILNGKKPSYGMSRDFVPQPPMWYREKTELKWEKW